MIFASLLSRSSEDVSACQTSFHETESPSDSSAGAPALAYKKRKWALER